MAYRSLRECLEDLHGVGELIKLSGEIDPYLDLAELTRRVHKVQGPALYFEQVRGSPFPAASHIFGTLKRCEYIFRGSLSRTQRAIRLRADPSGYLARPSGWWSLPSLLRTAHHSLPRRLWRQPPVLKRSTSISALPQLVSWPDDGGAFLTLPQVLSFDPMQKPNMLRSNLGMYRIQLSGGSYQQDKEVGLHYQLHRGIGIHHTQACKSGKPWKVGIFLGGPPAHTLAAIMPMPEGLSELVIAGMLAGRSVRWGRFKDYRVLAEADFCILGEVVLDSLKPEGPFGDHLGYYSLLHDFPFMKVEHVFHRPDAVMPFTVVGRPPQEDSIFGALIHKLTSPMVSVSLPGVHELHAVDEAGVHPLLLALGSERYVPYLKRCPMEVMTQAFAILGFNQCSLAKYLIIAAREDDESLNTRDIPRFLQHVLERIDMKRDLHLLPRTTIDTLDYSSPTLNFGSKLVITCAGEPVRSLAHEVPQSLAGICGQAMVMPGVAAITLDDGKAHSSSAALQATIASVRPELWGGVPWVVVSDDAGQLAGDFRRFLWETFTRSHPSDDLHGFQERWQRRHWQFEGPLFIDARSKPHHAPPLVADEASSERVDAYIDSHPQLRKLFSQ